MLHRTFCRHNVQYIATYSQPGPPCELLSRSSENRPTMLSFQATSLSPLTRFHCSNPGLATHKIPHLPLSNTNSIGQPKTFKTTVSGGSRLPALGGGQGVARSSRRGAWRSKVRKSPSGVKGAEKPISYTTETTNVT